MTTKEVWQKRLEKFNNDWINLHNWPRGTVCVTNCVQDNDGTPIKVAAWYTGDGNPFRYGSYSIL